MHELKFEKEKTASLKNTQKQEMVNEEKKTNDGRSLILFLLQLPMLRFLCVFFYFKMNQTSTKNVPHK